MTPSSHYRDALLQMLAPKRRVFVSYHHGGDRPYYSSFSAAICGEFDAVEDNSVERAIDSDDAHYVIRAIRENYITGTSCTFVLCGAETPWRKFVDWEIKATLDADHSLVAVVLPTSVVTADGQPAVPARLEDNVLSGYAVATTWHSIMADPMSVKVWIEIAAGRPRSLIINSRELRRRNC